MTGRHDVDREYMRRALELADAGWGRVHPNPLVGAVVVRNGEVVGTGAHREYGGPHAEVEALREAGPRARGSTLYVTLEPCAHHGKTPPCTDAILEHGVARVVYAVPDPHPTAGGGGARLRDAGVEVEEGVEAGRARAGNALFLRRQETGRAFVAVKFGMSVDARIAARPEERTRVTGPEAEAEVHRLRAGYDAILVGGRTARIDDPSLTVRHAPAPRVPPVRVVADPGARLPLDSMLARTAREVPVVVLAGDAAPQDRVAALQERGVEVERVRGGDAGLDLVAALDALQARGIGTVLCEGGGRLAASLLACDRVDRLYIFQAPTVFGAEGVPAFPGGARFRGRRVAMKEVGEDSLVIIDRSD
ncbi:MAG: bifunctional diaminohydroxyphosphoribosylaminopyrimidine deaminase/5-amino-6-(5-phosphoribosylamino)uracil reductase RibD [Longimicrobiales bacterium]|nr:bifunctional diaminohydroxyphosphoribosylaminopyrimidine deaminase/5-amino-6-(5-phosphoribosylamino)uracil reductase RibD [Longimicrobiales bacterium]